MRIRLPYRVTMRQGLVPLALLGASIGLETFLAPGPGWARAVIGAVEWVLGSLVLVILISGLVQRLGQIREALAISEHSGGLWRLLWSTPHGPFLLLHGGLLLLIAAFGYSKAGAIEAVMELPVGGESRVAVMDDGRRVTLPFTVRANAFETEHYDTGEVKQFVGDVALVDGDQVVAARSLGVGGPLDYRGYRFSLFRFGYRGTRVTGHIRPIGDPAEATPFDAAVGGDLIEAGGGPVRLTDLVEHATRRTPDGDRDVGRSVVYEVSGRDGARYEVMSFESAGHVIDWRRAGTREFESIHLLRDRDASRALPFDHYLTISTIEPAKAIGLQIRYYPGLPLLLISAALVVAGVAWMMRFWKPPVASRPESIQSVVLTPSPLTPPPTFFLPRKGGGKASTQVIEGAR